VKVIVYADFNCVYCFLASQRADRLTREGTAEVDWRAVEHLPRLPVTGYKPRPGEAQPGGEAGEDDLAEAAQLALPGEQLPAGPPAVISYTRAAVSAYAEAITDGIQDRLRLRLFESIWAQGRNMSSAYDVRRWSRPCCGQPTRSIRTWSAPTCRLRSCTTPTRCGSYAGKAARSRLTEAR
jgi:predicted DsbA family dithiol-disulfide isomerase